MGNERECVAGQERETRIEAPDLPYLPRDPVDYRPEIGLIGCGGIAPSHLAAYRKAGYRVTALCDCDPARAEALRTEHYPDARVYADYRDVLAHPGVEVVDLATHPDVRAAQIEDAIAAGKHILSQKPFVLDVTRGRALVEQAEAAGVRLAVNHNGRWAPHFAYLRLAVAAGLVGEVFSVHFDIHWNHDWTAGTAFDSLPHLILGDFGIHWFDMLCCLLPDRPARRVYASTRRAPGQQARPPLLAQVVVEYDTAQASLVFDGFTPYGAQDRTVVVGTRGTLTSEGPDLNHQQVTLFTAEGYAVPELQGDWFRNGFHGTMAELLCAIEENREPYNSARSSLAGLELCFAAAASADDGRFHVPGDTPLMPSVPLDSAAVAAS